MELDFKDKKILSELDRNARQSFKKIGKKVKLSKETIQYRIKKLEKAGIIKGYFSVIDIRRLGYSIYRCFVKLKNTSLEEQNKIIENLKLKRNIGSILEIRGDYTINFSIWAKSDEDFLEAWENFYNKYRKLIEKVHISKITKMYNFRRSYLNPKEIGKEDYEILGKNPEKTKLDELELRILKILSFRAKANSVEIASKLKTTEKKVRERIKKLIKEKIILNFRTFFDLNLLGYNYFKVHFKLNKINNEIKRELFNYSKLHPNIIYVTEAIGGFDFEIEIQVEGINKFYEIIDDMSSKFGKIISEVQFLEYIKEHKINYNPIK